LPYRGSRVTPVEGRGLSERRTQDATKDTGIDDESRHPTVVFRSCRRRYMPKLCALVCVFSESRMRENCLSGSMSGCSVASGRSSGERPAREDCPVVSVVISGGGAGDQTVESPEVKVPVGWVEA